jgi:hypothetical protein
MASCWLCLDDEADHCGKPPVRDCSCRGDDAGFAHVSCIVDYARRKSREAADPVEFVVPWARCENCKQRHENQLRIDLLDEFKRFVDEQYPGSNWRHLAVQNQFLGAVLSGAEISREKQEEIIDTTLSVIDQLSIDPDPSSSSKIELLKATTLGSISDIRMRQEDLTEDEAMKCLGYLEEGRRIRESFGDALGVAKVETSIAYFKERCVERFGAQEAFGKPSVEKVIERLRNTYQLMSENFGEATSLQAGVDLATLLSNANHTVESWRLSKRLLAISQQYHGREHGTTIKIEGILANLNVQCVLLRSLGFRFRAIGYEDDKYVLRGPIGVPEEQRQTLRVDPTDVILDEWNLVPVVCHGLKNNAAYLNGKIGDLRSFDETTGRYGVYFEDKAIKPKSVKLRNLRILFELPDN